MFIKVPSLATWKVGFAIKMDIHQCLSAHVPEIGDRRKHRVEMWDFLFLRLVVHNYASNDETLKEYYIY